ncbi:aminodeoxychorismate synthase component I [Coraliomargarita akajimensis]|uniref:aminodeoxychorismate synthase n=1 Tax=Coraliomargarita akajimensis (strain DSM 45221 / IAM 15411 / JCM 23193 / KCTC 12865 / 04OKA010-24) TaxID=583355 RepID=D5END2_CORAD|nr:aminodeoxychorismate synthase component I [Coraliomargarita akajimensis]ADE55408.1 para-aminobenzoate synthase, subunit I [Coraliomargarita akajimensis DSM 45221]
MLVKRIEDPPSIERLIEFFGRQPYPFILDSAQRNDGLGEWSFFGANPCRRVTSGLEELSSVMAQVQCANDTPIPFVGGAVGYLSYDYGRRLERMPELANDDREIPDLHFALYDQIAAFNHQSGELWLVAHDFYRSPEPALEELEAGLRAARAPEQRAVAQLGDWNWSLGRPAFCRAVEKVREYIASGDVYQVNLSRRARCRFKGDALALYQFLRQRNPAPYGAYLSIDGLDLFSTSPEQLLVKRGRRLETRPIKGTRPRGRDAVEDAAQMASLEQSAKDRAELLMIVDLERNDLGRVAEWGSVSVEGLYNLEKYARVIHQTARVRATLRKELDVFDCLRALFPGGSITGAPKVRAMQVIEELEPTRRGAYCGSLGYIGFDGDAEFNIAIRSLHLKDGWLDYQVGSGIVWDSDPEAEYLETEDKGRAIVEAIESYRDASNER